jgi:hypothetical protein
MYPVDDSYKDAIRAPTRDVTCTVTFDITDVTAYQDVSGVVAAPEAPISDKTQIVDRARIPSYVQTTWEAGRFTLDGVMSFPDEDNALNGEMGFVSAEICGASRVFSSRPTLTIDFASLHSSIGLTISFDVGKGECGESFEVIAYDAAGGVVDNVLIEGNTDVIRQAFGQLDGYKRIVIRILRWSVPNRRARVMEVDFGIVREYGDDNLISAKLIEDMDPMSGQLPSPEFSFTVDNSGKEFNILNPTGFYIYLQEWQPVTAAMGVRVNGAYRQMPLGEFYLMDWTSEAGALTTSFTARTALERLGTLEYEQLMAKPQSLAELAESVFTAAEFDTFRYAIDPALKNVQTLGFVERTDCKTLMQMIALAGRCVVYVSRSGAVTLKRVETEETADARIDFGVMFDEAKIQLSRLVREVEVAYWTDSETSSVVSATVPYLTMGDTLKVEDNKLINTEAQAQQVADWLLMQAGKRAMHDMNWRGDPAHELGDTVAIENAFGEDIDAMITRQEIAYAGYLSARTEARGAAN